MAKSISTTELQERLRDPLLTLVDVRPMAAYNGWPLKGETRGGHIRGAVACPLPWGDLLTPEQMAEVMANKRISPERSIVIYGYEGDDCASMAARLEAMSFTDVSVYEAGLAAWAAEPNLPMDHLANYQKLVYPEWVSQLLAGEKPPAYTGSHHALFHVNFGVPEEYAESHLPGAMHLDTNLLETSATWNRRTPEELRAALQTLGITPDTLVVVYGRDSVARPGELQPGRHAGQIAATRAAAILMYAGVRDVRLLDGGYNAWVAAGYEVETEPHIPVPTPDFEVEIPLRPELIVDIDTAKELLAVDDGVLVSIRSWPEYVGNVSGYNYIGRKGRIAGSVWGNCGTDAYHMQHYRNPDNTMREYHEIERNWQEMGITPDKRVAFYCGTGWRASETLFYAHLMGWPDVAVYDGGWHEWSADERNPIEVGEP